MSTNGGSPLIEVRDLEKHFPLKQGIILQRQVGAVRAVDGISFDVHEGETLGLVGESGCGKSTTARLVTRLLEPTNGSIVYKGDDIAHASRSELKPLRRDMQMIFQDPYSSLNPRKTVGKIVELADADQLFDHPRHPYTGALLSAVPVPDPRLAREKNRQVLGGDVPSPTNPPVACRFHTRCPKAVDGKCNVDEPFLDVKQGGNLAACHFPLTDEEIAARVPTAAA